MADTTREFREMQRQLQDVDRQMAQRGARLRLLQQLQERWEGFGEGAKAVLQGRLSGALAGSKATPVSQGIEVKPEYGRAIEALLGSAVEAIQVSDLATARRIFAQLEQEQIGSVVLRISRPRTLRCARWRPPAGACPGRFRFGPDRREPSGEGDPRLMLRSRRPRLISRLLERPSRIRAFLSVATRKGEVVDRRGLVSGGHANPKKQANSIVQREIESALKLPPRRWPTISACTSDRRLKGEALNAKDCGRKSRVLRGDGDAAVLTSTQALASAQAEERSARKGFEETPPPGQRGWSRSLPRWSRPGPRRRPRWEKAAAGLVQSEAAATAQRRRIDELEAGIAAFRVERDGKRETLAQARLELAERRQKVEVLDKGLGEMERRRQQIRRTPHRRRQREVEAWTGQIVELEGEESGQRANSGESARKPAFGGQSRWRRSALSWWGWSAKSAPSRRRSPRCARSPKPPHESLSAHEVRLAETRQRGVFLSERRPARIPGQPGGGQLAGDALARRRRARGPKAA